MPDDRIVELYWQRSESAIHETADKYGDYCHYIAYNILYNREDAEESVNDTWLDAWNNMPPHKPSILSTFLGKITRRISIDRWRKKHAGKRGGGEMDLVLDELEDCVSDPTDVEMVIEQQEMARVIREFLDGLGETERRIFLRRYWYMDSIAGIALEFDFTESKTASMLHRTRGKLRDKLESEGYL
ncbi:MAG: sigma-70 family RNA polymerase sigma factor [Clostridia bacterium]|nr:sigma-70 family RNA polymerase sigma factor [Clostridia bacterium]